MAATAAIDAAEPAAAPRPLAAAWWMVAALFVIYVFSWVDRMAIAMLVTPIKASLHLTDAQMGLVLGSSFGIAYAVFGVPLGWAADRFARRWVIFCGVLVWAAATLGCGLVHSFGQLLAARVMVGIGEAALLPAAYSLIGDAFPPDKVTLATAVFQSGGKTGSAAAFGLGGLAIAAAKGLEHVAWPAVGHAPAWQIAFGLVGVPGFALALLALSFPDPGRRERVGPARDARRGETRAFLGRHAALVALVMLAFTCFGTIGYSQTSWVPSYMERHFGWQPARYGLALSAMNLMGAAALIGCGHVVDRLYARGMMDAHLRFYCWTIVALSPALIAAYFVTSPYLFLACYALSQLLTVPYAVYGAAIIALLAPSHLRGRLLGLLLFVTSIVGSGAGPVLVGWLTDHALGGPAHVGMALAIVVIGGAAIALAAMWLALPRLAAAVRATI